MSNIFSKAIATVATTGTALSVLIVAGANNPAQAIEFKLNWEGNAGYSALGSFSYNEDTAPASFSEEGLGETNVLESLSISFFNPSNELIGDFMPVIDGVSVYQFLSFGFDTVNHEILALDGFDAGKDQPVPNKVVGDTFLSNIFLDGSIIDPTETFYLSQVVATDPAYALLDSSTNSVEVSKVPEPASILGLLAFSTVGASLTRKKKQAS